MANYDLIKEVERELEENHSDPFENFGIRGDLRKENPSELSHLMVGYDEYSKKLLLSLGRLVRSDSLQNRRIAIIGPQGVGKTTLTREFVETTHDSKVRDRLTFLKEVNMVQNIPLKYFVADNKMEIFHQLIGKRLPKQNILIFDDSQEVFFPSDKGEKSNPDIFEKINEELNSYEKSLFLFTFTTFGWKNAISKIPDFVNLFDEIIWLGGIENDDLKNVINRRLAEFSTCREEPTSITSIFEKEGDFDYLAKHSSKNPRLLIHLVASSIEEASEAKVEKVNRKIVNGVLKSEGIEQIASNDANKLLKNKLFYSMLSYKYVSINFIRQFTGLDRTTIQRELAAHHKFGRIVRKKNNANKREFLYGIKNILRALLEITLMERIEERTESLAD